MPGLGCFRHSFEIEDYRQDDRHQDQDGQTGQIQGKGDGRHDVGLPGLGNHGLGTSGVVMMVIVKHEVMQTHCQRP